MTQLLILREHIQKMYQRYSSFFQVVMRFMVGFGLFFATTVCWDIVQYFHMVM